MGMKTIRKHTQNVWIDTLSLICMIVLTVTGILLKFKLPPGSHKESLWGMSRHEWGDFHFWVAIVLVISIAIHMLLHIPWIQGVVYPKNDSKKMQRAILFTAGFAVLLGVSAMVLFGKVVHHG